ncbi:hypothetical protein [Rickettsia endosymbiont of Orchestes rusci]
MIKSRHDTAFFQRSYSSGPSHGMTILSDFNHPRGHCLLAIAGF